MADRELLQQALDALVNARDYVNAEYVARSNLYAAYPHRWATEREDLAKTDATIAALRSALGDPMGKLISALEFVIRHSDSLTPSDIQRMQAILAEVGGKQ